MQPRLMRIAGHRPDLDCSKAVLGSLGPAWLSGLLSRDLLGKLWSPSILVTFGEYTIRGLDSGLGILLISPASGSSHDI